MDRVIQHSQDFWARENSPAALAAAISQTVFAMPKPDAQALHRAIAARFSWPKVFSRLFDLYDNVIQNFHRLAQPH